MVNQTEYCWSLKKWQNLVDSGVLQGDRVELIEGKITKMSPERADHAFYTSRLANKLRTLLESANKAVIREAHPITLQLSEPEPDIAIVRYPEYLYLQHHPYPEDIYWLIEISRSTINFDLNQKLKIYAKASIREYWVLNLNKRSLAIFQDPNPKQQCYRQQLEVSEQDDLRIDLPGFSGLAIDNLSIWDFSK